uniref:P-type domain-containing protein n=1 Tax=Laticauda laticaudata TaxID=8630 RepID=A0A8C5RDK4_LATLA
QAAMEQKFWLLVMVLFLGFSIPGQCQVQPNARVNCGYPYISAQECYNRGCCFDSSIVGVIWCFFPQQNAGIDSDQCYWLRKSLHKMILIII